MGRMYVGDGLSLLARKSTVGSIRSASSALPRCKPPIIYTETISSLLVPNAMSRAYHMNRPFESISSVCGNIDDASMRTATTEQM
jgi:hypothetical protein